MLLPELPVRGVSVHVVGAGVGAKLSVGLGLGQFDVQPPPHAQHMSAAVKSSSLWEVEHDEDHVGATDGDEHE